jgi:PIN domain nuclease of toxin-antitoxin system
MTVNIGAVIGSYNLVPFLRLMMVHDLVMQRVESEYVAFNLSSVTTAHHHDALAALAAFERIGHFQNGDLRQMIESRNRHLSSMSQLAPLHRLRMMMHHFTEAPELTQYHRSPADRISMSRIVTATPTWRKVRHFRCV